jgi:hypothetical protein
MFGSLAEPPPAIAANAVVHFVSNDVGGAWTNQGYVYVALVQYAFGQWYPFNTGTYRLDAETTIPSGGNRYDFDHWGYDGAVTITDLYDHTTSITITGEGNVYAWYVLQDFTIDVAPSSLQVQSPNTAQYSFTVTRINIPQDVDKSALFRVDLSASGMSWSANGPNYQFVPATANFFGQSNESPITGTLFINTVNAAAGQYTITVKGQLYEGDTYHEKQVSLKINPSCPGYPDLIITDFYWTPSNPAVGQAISITYTEKNQGECDAPGHRNALYIDGVLISSDDVGPLAAGASQTRTFPQTWTVSSGPHVVLVKADSTNVVYEGEPGSDRENNNSLDKTLGSKIDTQLTVAVTPPSVPPGGGTLVTVSGKLTRTDTGEGMADRSISLSSPGIYTFVRTNSMGDYSYSYVTPNLAEGSWPVSAYYEGDSTFSSCSAQTNLGVGKIPTAITINLNPASISSGTPTVVAISGKLSGSDTGAGLNGKSVKLDWPTGSTTVTTDSTGSYSYSLTLTATQSWVFQATFFEDSTYLQSSNTATLTVGQATPVLAVSPTSLDFGTSDTGKSFNIANAGGGTLTWSLSSNQAWLTATPTSGSGNAAITVNVNRSGLNSGNYTGIITVSSNGGTSTVSVSVSMQSVDKTIRVLYQGNLYTVKITVPLSRYQRATDAAQGLASVYPNVDQNLLAESIYLYYYVNGPANDPIFRVAIYQNGQPIHDTNLKGQILDGLLTYCYLLVGAGSTDHIRLYQENAKGFSESYQGTANTVKISDALSNAAYLLTIVGPILDDLTKIFGDLPSEQVSAAVSFIDHSFGGTQSLVKIYGQQKADTIISILKQNNLIQTSDYNPAQLYQAFTANPSGAAQAISEIDKTVFNTDLTEDAKSIISAVIKELGSAAIGDFASGTAMGLYAYFCSQLTASTAAQIGASAAFNSFVSSGLPIALASAIAKSYVLPMANALHDAWEAMGDVAVSYTELGLDVQSIANPSLTANAFDITIAREAAMGYGVLCISEFFYYANTYQYKDGQFFGRNELPGLKSSADMALANAKAWQATLQQIQTQASALANSADPDSVSFDFLFTAPSNYLPTMPLADGFAVVTDSSSALLSLGDYSFTVQNGKWSSSFEHSFYVSDANGSSYLVVVDSPTGQASIQTDQGTDISVLSYDTSDPGIISVSQEIAQSSPEVNQEIAQSSTSAFLVSNTASTVTVMPAPLDITTTSLSNGYVGSTYAAILTASGGNGTRAWLAISGTLPDGLSLNPSTGVISGTATSSGVFDFTVQVTDNVASTTKALSIKIMIRHGVNWWLIGAIIAAVALIGGGVGLLVRRRTRKA